MLGLNKPATEYPLKMLWYEQTKNTKGVQSFKPNGVPFKAKYTSSEDIHRLNLNQGMVGASMFIETESYLPMRNNDKIVYNGKQFIIKNMRLEPNATAGGKFTNKPESYIKYIEAD
jgi:hypothetical protein